MADKQQVQGQLLQPQRQEQQLQQTRLLHGMAADALTLLQEELNSHQPSVSTASIILGILQQRLISGQDGGQPLAAAVAQHAATFQEQLVSPAAAKLGPKCRQSQDKVVAVAKFLRGKLAKAPAHKQPLHTQYLPSALHNQGKRQLDCLGIATAVLGMCHAIAAQHSAQHADLAAACMVVSDDHCWLALPQQQQQQAGHAAAGSTGPDDVQQLVHVEVTDPRPLQAADMANWLYAGAAGSRPCSAHQVIMILVAGLMPEELKDAAAALQLAAVQMALLGRLAAAHPAALFYSNFFRWGMLHEEGELQQLVEAAEAGLSGELQRLALLRSEQLQSQCCYAESICRSSGMQWHPHSCAAFGWLSRMQAALCGDTDELLLVSCSWQTKAHGGTAAGRIVAASVDHEVRPTAAAASAVAATFWLGIATHLYEQALAAVGGCTGVLRQYAGAAGKPDKSADKQLMEAVGDLWANLADACKAIAALQYLADAEQQQGQQQLCSQSEQGAEAAAAAVPAVAVAAPRVEASAAAAGPGSERVCGSSADNPDQQLGSSSAAASGHLCSDVQPAAPASPHNMQLAATASVLKAGQQLQQQQQPVLLTKGILSNSFWLQVLLELLDAVCTYFGDESADLPADVVKHFLVCAAAFTTSARVQAASHASTGQRLHSSRVAALADAGAPAAAAWQEMGLDLQQLLQMPGSRKRKRKELR